MMQKPKLIWLNVTVFTITALVTLVGVPIYAFTIGFDGWQVAAMLMGILFCEISITAGYHRLWAHRAYEAHWLVRFFFAVGGTFATQNSILHWASDHRLHHRNTDDNNNDPYSAKRGFWYSHMGWMLREYETNPDTDYKTCADLKKDPIVMWQHRFYLPLVLGLNFGIPILLGLLHSDFWGMILLAGFARLFFSHHFTFFINSLAHLWGSQPYSDKSTARDNGLLAILTLGEGYHNFHHSFQRDYRNGIRWWQFDPTKWLIKSLSWLGLTKDLYQIPVERIESARAKMQLQQTASKLVNLPHADLMLLRLQAEYEKLVSKLQETAKVRRQWLEARRNAVRKNCDVQQALREKFKTLKASYDEQKRDWVLLNARLA